MLRLVSRANAEVDGGWLCDRGRFETVPTPQNCRPARPLLRRDGSLVEVTWSAALARAAELLGTGGGIVASSSLSNEALWLLQRVSKRMPVALWPRAALASDWPYLTETLGDAGIRVGHTAPEIAAALDALTRERLDAARTAMLGLRPAYEWAPLATRTFDLFERVVLEEP